MATPPRAQFVDIAGYTDPNGAFAPVTTTRVTVYLAVPYAGSQYTTLATLRSAETGSGTPGNPFDATTGEINFWAAPGSYDIKIEDLGGPAKFATKYIRWDPIPGDKGLASTMITDDAVTAPAIAASAVTSSEILDGTVGAAELASDAVTTSKILDANVTLAKLATDSVNSSKIVDASIALGDLSPNSVDSSKIVDGSIVNADINASAAIAKSKLALTAAIGNADLSITALNTPSANNAASPTIGVARTPHVTRPTLVTLTMTCTVNGTTGGGGSSDFSVALSGGGNVHGGINGMTNSPATAFSTGLRFPVSFLVGPNQTYTISANSAGNGVAPTVYSCLEQTL